MRASARRRNPFGLLYRGRSVYEWPVEDSGVRILSPAFDYLSAAKVWGAGKTPTEFAALPIDDQEWIIAHYRASNRLDAVLAYQRKLEAERERLRLYAWERERANSAEKS